MYNTGLKSLQNATVTVKQSFTKNAMESVLIFIRQLWEYYENVIANIILRLYVFINRKSILIDDYLLLFGMWVVVMHHRATGDTWTRYTVDGVIRQTRGIYTIH